MLWRIQRVWLNVIEYGEYDGYTWSFAEEYDVQMYIRVALHRKLTLLGSGFFGSLKARGGADLPPPSKNGGNGWEVQKLSWNLISYQD